MSTSYVCNSSTLKASSTSLLTDIEQALKEARTKMLENNAELRDRINSIFGPDCKSNGVPESQKREPSSTAELIELRIDELFSEIEQYRSELARLERL